MYLFIYLIYLLPRLMMRAFLSFSLLLLMFCLVVPPLKAEADTYSGLNEAASTSEIPDGMNVLFIVCDDLNDFEGVFGGHPQAQTPHMDALAADAVQFVNAHTNAPICGPSRSSFMTGIYPHNSNVFGFNNWYNPGKTGFSVNTIMQNSKTLQHYLRDNGFISYGSGKLLHHDLRDDYVYPSGHPEAGNPQEYWDAYGDPAWAGPFAYNQNTQSVVNHPKIPNTFYQGVDAEDKGAGSYNSLFGSLADVPNDNGSTGWWNATWEASGAYRYVNENDRDDMQDERVRKWATGKIDEMTSADPTGENNRFIMSIGFHNPHTPFVAPQSYFDLYPIETLQLPTRIANDVEDTFFDKNVKLDQSTLHVYQSLLNSVGEASLDGTVYQTEEAFLKAYLQAYLACVSFVDTQVGALIDALDASPYADNTLVILTSDHGYEWGEKEALSKNTLWENSTRVPLLIRVPGLEANNGKQVDVPVSLIDLYPTIRDLCGLEADTKKTPAGHDLDGHSLRPLLENPEAGIWTGPPVALSMVSAIPSDNPGDKNYAVRSKHWRYIRYENGMEELYNHSDPLYAFTDARYANGDPHEEVNLLISDPTDPVVVRMYAYLVNQLLTMVPALATDKRNLLVNPGFEWLPSPSSSPNPGGEMWASEESDNLWEVTRGQVNKTQDGKYSLEYRYAWESRFVTQTLAYPLDSSQTYELSFWMHKKSSENLAGSNNPSISVQLWTSPTVEGTYQYRANWVTDVENTIADTWEQFSGQIDASTLAAYDGDYMQLRIKRNSAVNRKIYLDDFVLDAYEQNSFSQWAYEEGLNPAGYAYDLDGDSLSALEEYAFGGNPQDALSVGYKPELAVGASSVSFYYPQRKGSALQYQLEFTTDLSAANWSTVGLSTQSPTEEFDGNYWKAASTLGSKPDACFFRTRIDF